MITFKEFLTESKSAPLYHGTRLYSLTNIIKEDKLEARLTHNNQTPSLPRKGFESDRGTAISLTRNFKTAYDWTNDHIVLELDQQKLSYNYKIKPVEIEYIWAKKYDRDNDYRNKSSGLYEEYVTEDIKPLSRYLVKIHVTNYVYKNYVVDTTLRDHPLLWSIADKKWINK